MEGRGSWAAERQQRRRLRRERSRTKAPELSAAMQQQDPLAHPPVPRQNLVTAALVAIGLHGSVLLLSWVGPGPRRDAPSVDPTPTSIEIVDTAPEPAPEPEEVLLEQEPIAEVAALAAEVEADEEYVPPPPDAIDLPEPTSQVEEPPPSPTRRVVGLSFESTVASSGGGPRFATGNTRSGKTASVAEDPGKVEKIARAELSNQRSDRVPTGSVQRTQPVRVYTPACEYPPLLKAQGVEAKVTLILRVDAAGNVASAKVVRASEHTEFNQRAERCALQHRYEPATKNGEAVAYTINYTHNWYLD